MQPRTEKRVDSQPLPDNDFPQVGLVVCLLALALCLSGLLSVGAARAGNVPSPERRVILISVDGLPSQLYLHPEKYGLHIPNLMRLKSEGSYAEALEEVYPSVTYPSHTTMVTGRWPREHGIFTNLSSRKAGVRPRDWFWYAEAIRVPTLWDLARKKGLRTGAVSWPVTAGAQIDWNIPEIWGPSEMNLSAWEVIARHASPPRLLEEAFKALGPPRKGEPVDNVRMQLTNYILKTYRPDLFFLHLADLDSVHHRTGPRSKKAIETLERIDGLIGEIRRTVEEAGLADETAYFIVSDHGFMAIRHTIHPNTLLAEAGLLSVNSKGQISGGEIATGASGGAFLIYWPEERNDELARRVDEALRPLRQQDLLWGIFGEEAVADLHADEGARLILEAADGYSFGGRATGPWLENRTSVGGSHGYLPTRREMDAAFIAAGPGLEKRGNLGRIKMVSIGPTVAAYLEIAEPGFAAAEVDDIIDLGIKP